jgi:hypothetical protein
MPHEGMIRCRGIGSGNTLVNKIHRWDAFFFMVLAYMFAAGFDALPPISRGSINQMRADQMHDIVVSLMLDFKHLMFESGQVPKYLQTNGAMNDATLHDLNITARFYKARETLRQNGVYSDEKIEAFLAEEGHVAGARKRAARMIRGINFPVYRLLNGLFSDFDQNVGGGRATNDRNTHLLDWQVPQMTVGPAVYSRSLSSPGTCGLVEDVPNDEDFDYDFDDDLDGECDSDEDYDPQNDD